MIRIWNKTFRKNTCASHALLQPTKVLEQNGRSTLLPVPPLREYSPSEGTAGLPARTQALNRHLSQLCRLHNLQIRAIGQVQPVIGDQPSRASHSGIVPFVRSRNMQQEDHHMVDARLLGRWIEF